MNLTTEKNNDLMAPEETPPNKRQAGMAARFLPLKRKPWNEWLRLARQGDENAKLFFCAQAEPFIEQFCRISYFNTFLGKEEIRGIATLAVTEFMMTYPAPPEDKEMPFVLKSVIRNALINPAKRAEVRSRREKHVTAVQNDGENDTETGGVDTYPAKRKEEPETKLLDKELRHATAEAFRRLKPDEQTMLRAFFFQNKTAAAIAKELQCTRQYVEKVRNEALRRMRRMLEGQNICDCCM